MKDFYQFLIKKFNVKENEKFTLVVNDCGNEQYYPESYITENGFYNGSTNDKFTGNFIFKILNGKYRIEKQVTLKLTDKLYFIDFDGNCKWDVKSLVNRNHQEMDNIDFKAAMLYKNGLLFATPEEALLPSNVFKAKKFYEALYQEFMDGVGLNELQK